MIHLAPEYNAIHFVPLITYYLRLAGLTDVFSFALQADVDNDIKLLTQKNEEISEVVNKLESNSENLEIDEAVVTTAPLYNQ